MSATPEVAALKEWSNVGELLFGDDLNANFAEIVTAYESHTHTEYPDQAGTETISGLWTFSNAGGIKTDIVAERTAAAGITLDGVLLKDGGIKLAALARITLGSAGDDTYLEEFANDNVRFIVGGQQVISFTTTIATFNLNTIHIGYVDYAVPTSGGTPPSAPGAGYIRFFVDGSGVFKSIDSGGNIKSFDQTVV